MRVHVLAHEAFRRGLRELGGERFDHDQVDLRGGEQFELLFGGGEHRRRAIRLQDLARMRIECVDDGLAIVRARAVDHRAQDLAVTDVETVEVADREDRATRTAIERCTAPYDPQC